MNKALLVALLTSQISFGQTPGQQSAAVITLKCESGPSSIGDTFEYEFRIETKANGAFELKDGTKVVLQPLNITQNTQKIWQKINVQVNRIELSSTQYNRLLEHTMNEKFVLDRTNNEFTLARTIQDISKKQAADAGLVQLQSGSCTEKIDK